MPCHLSSPWILFSGNRQLTSEPRRAPEARQRWTERRRDRSSFEGRLAGVVSNVNPYEPICIVALGEIVAEVAEPRFGANQGRTENEARREQHRLGFLQAYQLVDMRRGERRKPSSQVLDTLP